MNKCPKCKGMGDIEWYHPNDVCREDPAEFRICPNCDGTGKREDDLK